MAEIIGQSIVIDECALSSTEARRLAAKLYRLAKLVECGSKLRPSQSEVRRQLRYDPASGQFVWLVKSARNIIVGQRAGTRLSTGYILIRINGESYSAHRLAWLYMTGEWPAEHIDHKNRQRDDNRWSNLRKASVSQNHLNSRLKATNTTGLKGAWPLPSGRYYSQFQRRYLGSFDTPEGAHAAYMAAATKHHPQFAYDGVS